MTLPRDARIEVASLARDPNLIVYGGGVLRPTDDTLLTRGGGRGLKIYDEIERDPHAYAVLQKRKMAIIAREWRVDAASDRPIDQQAAELVSRQLKALNFDHLSYGLGDAILKGYAVGEILWAIRNGEVVADRIEIRDQRRFAFTIDGELRLLTLSDMVEGEPVPDRKFIVHRFGAKDGSPYGLGLGTRLFWPVLFKRQGLSYLLRFIERFGMPTIVGKYPNGAQAEDKATLFRAVQALTSEAGVVVPEGMLVELLEAKQSGSIVSHETLLTYLDGQMSEAVLGETLTTNAGKIGSQALGTVHNAVREELTDADADLQCAAINDSLVKWIVHFNMPSATAPRVWREKPADELAEEELLTKRAARVKAVRDLGFEPTSDEVYQRLFGDDFQRIKAPIAAPADPASFAAGDPPDDAVAGLVEALAGPADAEISAMMVQVRALLSEVKTLAEFGSRLIELYPTLDIERLGELLGNGLIAADLTGRVEVDGGR